jgi:Immunity protein 26
MKKKNSGNIYQFTLNHNLGFGYCEFVDYSDVSTFSGKLIYVFDIIDKKRNDNPDVEKISNYSLLFGPVPLLKTPNIKGKGAWKLIGKTKNLKSEIPIFKDVRGNYTKKDWTKLGSWFPLKNFHDVGQDCGYELLRHFELPVLYGMKEIEIRTTIHLLLLNNKNVKEYYDLTDFHLRNIYIRVVNTSFNSKDADRFLKEID